MKTRIVQFTMEGQFVDSYKTSQEAAEKVGIKNLQSNIYHFISGKQRGSSLGGYIWAKVECNEHGIIDESLMQAYETIKPYVVKNIFNDLDLQNMSTKQLDQILECFKKIKTNL